MIAGNAELFLILALAIFWLVVIAVVLYMTIPDGFHLERRHVVYLGIGAAALLTYVACLTAIYHSAERQDFWKYLGLFLGPALVAIGWIVTNEVNVLNSRKQHTINLILQYFTNAQRIKDKDCLNSDLPWPKKIDGAVVNFDNTADPLLRTVARELNYFDFLASAILRREIEERLLRRVFQDVVRHYYIQFESYIQHWRAENTDTWADFVSLYDRWKLPSDPVRSSPTLSDAGGSTPIVPA
jgi:hypothetical protein